MTASHTTDDLLAAGERAVARALEALALDIREPGTGGHPGSAVHIDEMIRGADGVGWTWEDSYTHNGQYQWCGAFVAWCWGLSLPLAMRRAFFPSTYRLERWSTYRPLEHAPNHEPAPGAFRRLRLVLDDGSTAGDLLPHVPRAGDILLLGTGRPTSYGSHVALVERWDGRRLHTVEGNATGFRGAKRVEGVVRQTRSIGGQYHVRRLLRPATTDLLEE